ncbi:protein C2-DOMAIN ABA-RELATED 4-like isoform X1 [Humulus lupulus]|uniref:protein C2-DOMAIN ABA-RELATED 4-like isoform X1 n=1 Tax=Humulus lupulus TaxID=3486 RepID=UPI002B418514|nr:protein C2-DOMAIN ABA-RELATED 4-like isoform X1 [Humulus lupulus]
MEHIMGLLRIHVHKGVDLAIRDVVSSDPYVVIRMGKQLVYDKDTFSMDDKMGDAEFDIRPFVEALRMRLAGLPSGTIITKVQPSRQNCLSEESSIIWSEGKLVQNICLRLKNVESGEVELQLEWINVPGSRGI